MLTDVDLPAPGLLWIRWAALAASLTGIGFADVWFVDDRGAHRDDHGGSWARFALVDGARAVLYGHDRDHGGTTAADPPLDLLTGAPDWLPWDDLSPLAEADELGFVAWHAEGRWSRVRYRDGHDDGLARTVGAVLSHGNALAELAGIVTEWGRYELRSAGERYATFRELTDLVRALRDAESDRRYGRWLFLRIETTADGVQIERRYDSWPQWWTDDGVSGPWRTNLANEMGARGTSGPIRAR